VTTDEASPGGVGTGQIIDTSLRRGQNKAQTITHIVTVVGMMMGMFTMLILVMAQLGAYVGDIEAEVVSMLRWIGKMTFYGIGTCTCAVTMLGTIS
jgi:hypothetical protein